MSKNFNLYLRSHENAAFVTIDGKMHKGFAHSEEELRQNADAFQEMMIVSMKDKDTQVGVWMWVVTNHWQAISAWEMEKEKW